MINGYLQRLFLWRCHICLNVLLLRKLSKTTLTSAMCPMLCTSGSKILSCKLRPLKTIGPFKAVSKFCALCRWPLTTNLPLFFVCRFSTAECLYLNTVTSGFCALERYKSRWKTAQRELCNFRAVDRVVVKGSYTKQSSTTSSYRLQQVSPDVEESKSKKKFKNQKSQSW